jgi:two-component SAPR family response regulator
MKILVFENEISKVKDAFSDVNELDFNKSLKVEYVDKSQNFRDYKDSVNYDLIFVDIDLSPTSVKDGYGVIEDILKFGNKNIVVLTGNMVKEELIKRNLNHIQILSKPIFLDELKSIIEKFRPFKE